MRAVVLEKTGGPEQLVLREVADPQPRPDEAIVRVRAAGVCGRDLIDRRGGFPMMKLPTILGHEFAGEVVAVGRDVTSLAPGARVTNLHRPWCGHCASCEAGETVDCEVAWQTFGLSVDGAYAELVAAHHRALVELPAGVSFEAAAPLGCTAGVALRALRGAAQLRFGESVLVTGASGGVGMPALAIARLLGARQVVATTTSASKVDALKAAGADHVVVSTDGRFDAEVRKLSDGGVDVALELTGAPGFPGALRSLRRRGRLVIAGNITPEKLAFNAGAVILFSYRILGSHGASHRDLVECIDLLAKGSLSMHIDRALPLAQAADAHRLLADRGVVGRVVLQP